MPSVLIIEDDADSRRGIVKLFENEGWNVFEAGDGDTGVDIAIEQRPELILCDLLMPKFNGFQVCRTIRQQLQLDPLTTRLSPRVWKFADHSSPSAMHDEPKGT